MSNSCELRRVEQGQRLVADFAIDFRIKSATSGWNAYALESAYFHALNQSLKDKLAMLDEPATLEELISLIIWLDNRIPARAKEKSKKNSCVR